MKTPQKTIELNNVPVEIKDLAQKFMDVGLRDAFTNYLSDGIVNNRYNKDRNVGLKMANKELGSYGGKLDFGRYARYYDGAVPASYDIPISTLEQMRKDPQVALGLSIIKFPIIAANWRVVCDDINISKTIEYILRPIWNQLISDIMLSVDFGFAAFEKVWATETANVTTTDKITQEETVHYRGPLLTYKYIKSMHPSTISIILDRHGHYDGIKQVAPNANVVIPKIKGAWFTAECEYGNYYGMSRMNRVYNFWYWKNLLYLWMLQYFERRGTPPMKGRAPAGKTRIDGQDYDNLVLLKDILSNIANNSAVALPAEESKTGKNLWDVELLQDEKRGDMFIDAIIHMGAIILRGLLIPEKTIVQDASGGSYNVATVHADMFLLAQEALVKRIETWVAENIVKDLVEYNWPVSKRKEVRIQIDNLDVNKKQVFRDLFVEVLKNVDALAKIGIYPKVMPSMEKMADFLEIPTNPTEVDYDFVPIDESGNIESDSREEIMKAATKDELDQTRKIRQNAQTSRRKFGPKKTAIKNNVKREDKK